MYSNSTKIYKDHNDGSAHELKATPVRSHPRLLLYPSRPPGPAGDRLAHPALPCPNSFHRIFAWSRLRDHRAPATTPPGGA
jgi:hypothetical protein